MQALDGENPRSKIGLGGDRFWKILFFENWSQIEILETGSRLLELVDADRGLVARINFLRPTSDEL